MPREIPTLKVLDDRIDVLTRQRDELNVTIKALQAAREEAGSVYRRSRKARAKAEPVAPANDGAQSVAG